MRTSLILHGVIYLYLPTNIQCDSNKTNATSYRNKFCEKHKQLEHNQIERATALKGLTISVGIPDPINPAKPYIANEIMKEIARRGEFDLKFHVTGWPKVNQTWTDLLIKTIDTYDVACFWWEGRIARLTMGIVFPEAYYDANTVMISNLNSIEERRGADDYNFWAFTQPFSPGLWIMVVFMVILTGLVYYLLDYIKSKLTKEEVDTNFFGSIFFSFHSFTGHCNYTAKSRPTQILTTSMCFLYLIIISAYTANLANFFIAKNKPKLVINDIIDVTRNNIPMCVMKDYPNTLIIKAQFPNARLVEKRTIEESYIAASQGEECQIALSSMEEWKTLSRDDRFNQECDLEWIGRRIDTVTAGFALRDSRGHCSSLLDNVLNLHLMKMKAEGVIDRMWKESRERESKATCHLESNTESEDSLLSASVSYSMTNTQLNSRNMSGAFVFHIFLVLIAILIALVDFYRKPKQIKKELKRELRATLSGISSKRASFFNGNITGIETETEKAIRSVKIEFREENETVTNIQGQFEVSHTIEIIKNMLNDSNDLSAKKFDYILAMLSQDAQIDKKG